MSVFYKAALKMLQFVQKKRVKSVIMIIETINYVIIENVERGLRIEI